MEFFQHSRCFFLRFFPRAAVNPGNQLQIFARSELGRDGGFLRGEIDAAFDLLRLGNQRIAENLRVAGRRRKQTGEHLDRRGFARAVDAQQGKKLTLLYGQVKRIHGGFLAVTPGQFFRLDRVHSDFASGFM